MCFDDEKKKEITNKFDMEIDDAVNYVFRHFQRIYQIESGDEPFDTRIRELQKELAEECTRVLEFQLPFEEDNDDPKQDMTMQWEMILERDTGAQSREDYVSLHDGIRDLVDQFFDQIGEAMGPVSYAGFQLTQALKNHNLSTDWVSNCIQYYQDNWDM